MAGSLLSCSACWHRALKATSCGSKPLVEAGALLAGASNLSSFRQYATRSTSPASDGAPQRFDATSGGGPGTEKKTFEKMRRDANKQLQYNKDPWKVAFIIQQTLSKGQYDEALLLTQFASRRRQVVVAWNHLIDYQLRRQQLKKALQLYSEMKRRGQLPNAQTFTIIFRGCARSEHPKLAVAEAVKLYNILLNDTRLEANSIHLNAVLNVCARAGDIDSMFLVANTADDSMRTATAYTYTTLLNALRYHAGEVTEGLAPDDGAANVQILVNRAKGIWTEVMHRWERTGLLIDEELICAMGRMLLIAPNREDKREVLNMLEQTMTIPNLAKGSADVLPDPEMHNIAVTLNGKINEISRNLHPVPGRNTLALVMSTLASSNLTTCGIKYWNLMVRHYGIVPDNDIWLRMFGMLKVGKASAHAASILEIVPDEYIEGKHYRIAMETCVRDNVNPNAIANSNRVLDSMLERLPVPDLYALRMYLRIALVSHFQLREQAQNGDDVGAKRDYGVQITTALARLWEPYKKAHYHFFKALPANSNTENTDNTDNNKEVDRHTTDGNTMVDGNIARNGSTARDANINRRGANKRDGDNKDDNSAGILYNNKREVISLARLMFSAFNKVINEHMLPENDLRELRPIGAKINREIQSFYLNREEAEPKLRRAFSDNADDELDGVHGKFQPGGDFVWNTVKSAERGEKPGPRYKPRKKSGKRFIPRKSSGNPYGRKGKFRKS